MSARTARSVDDPSPAHEAFLYEIAIQDELERGLGEMAMGQARTRLLSQEKNWLDRSGNLVVVDEMPLSYLSALQKFLENRAGESLVSAAEYMTRFPLYRRISELLGDRRFKHGD